MLSYCNIIYKYVYIWYYLIKFIIFLLLLNYPVVVNTKKRYKQSRKQFQPYYKSFRKHFRR